MDFTEQLADPYTKLSDKMSGWLNDFILQLPNVAIAVVVAILAYFFSVYIKKIAVRMTQKATNNDAIISLASSLASVVFSILTLMLILNILNLDGTINKILATAGVVGLAVGLALQDPMNNLFSGVFMSVRDLYNIGDLVETNGYFGTIQNIDLRMTKLILPTGQEVVIPNTDVLQNPLKNYSVSKERRIDISCGISYGENLQSVEEIAISAIEALYDEMEKPVELYYNEFGDSSINFDLRFWIDTNTHPDFLKERSKAIKALKIAFDQQDIMIPFPIRTLDFNIKGGKSLKTMIPAAMRKEGALSENNYN